MILQRYCEIWRSIKPTGTTVWTATCVQEAIVVARENASPVNATHVLVTGSLYLVGATLELGFNHCSAEVDGVSGEAQDPTGAPQL